MNGVPVLIKLISSSSLVLYAEKIFGVSFRSAGLSCLVSFYEACIWVEFVSALGLGLFGTLGR